MSEAPAAHNPAPPVRPWIAEQTKQLLQQRGHAWLVQGPSGLGQYSLALALVRAWLCEAPQEQGACGHCASCHAIDVRTHADLCVLMPETQMLVLGWPLSEKAQSEIDDKKRKPSKEIRVEAMRDAVEFSQRTSSRGRGKAVLVFPAEQMNTITANALLKTLEEPPGDVKFVLATESAHQLLPTIRSRCLGHTMHWPTQQVALSWMESLGIATPVATLALKAAGGRPDDATAFIESGRDPGVWTHLRYGAVARRCDHIQGLDNATSGGRFAEAVSRFDSPPSERTSTVFRRQGFGAPVAVDAIDAMESGPHTDLSKRWNTPSMQA